MSSYSYKAKQLLVSAIDHLTLTVGKTSSKKLLLLLISLVVSLVFFIQFHTSSSTHEIIQKILPNNPLPTAFTNSCSKEDITYTSDEIDELLELPLLERLRKVFPYTKTTEPLEKQVIQSWKHNRLEDLGADVHSWLQTEGFNYTLYDDKHGYRLLLRKFGPIFPEIIETFNIFPRNILRFDFLRYLALFLNGGTYSDLDTVQIKPFTEWVTYNDTIYGEPNTVGVVVGLEGECDCGKWQGIFTRRVQFCQWTLQAKKHHPLFAVLISMIVEYTSTSYTSGNKIFKHNGNEYDFSKGSETYYDGILELTGPGIFTDAVFKYINTYISPNSTIINPNDQEEIWEKRVKHKDPEDKTLFFGLDGYDTLGWQNITYFDKPIYVDGDVLILPKPYFNGKKEENPEVLVQHRYHGSWKSKDGKK